MKIRTLQLIGLCCIVFGLGFLLAQEIMVFLGGFSIMPSWVFPDAKTN